MKNTMKIIFSKKTKKTVKIHEKNPEKNVFKPGFLRINGFPLIGGTAYFLHGKSYLPLK